VGWVAGAALIFTSVAHAQQKNDDTGVIYACTDVAGRALTSDRPIASCRDREQRVLSSQGRLLKVIPPELTDAQLAAQQEQERQVQLALQRQRSQQRGNQALLIRYPTLAAHEASRHAALAQTQTRLDTAQAQLAALETERASLAQQMTAYAQNPAAAPANLQHSIERNAQAIETQQRFITGYQAEADRINAQFNAEDKRLQPLWLPASSAPAKTP